LQNSQEHKALIIARRGLNTDLLIQEVSKNWEVIGVIYENAPSSLEVIRRRKKKIGFFKTMSQVSFMAFILPLLSSKKRNASLISELDLETIELDKSIISGIDNVNSDQLKEAVKDKKPDIVFINGTRIISEKTIDILGVPLVNVHVGITPRYRGVHGGYWALYDAKPDLFGVTIHYVDKGIDTGKIIDQEVIETSSKDNFKTYPLLQYMAGVRLIGKNHKLIKEGLSAEPRKLCKKHKLHYHPGFFQYLSKRISKGVK